MPQRSYELLCNALASQMQPAPSRELIRRYLQAIRTHLDMEVAYVSEFMDGRSHMREVDAPGLEACIKVGDSHSLDDVYCRHVIEGRLPQLIPDTSMEPLAASLPITQALPIGKHLSVPIRLPDGSAYGMLCCLGFHADPSLRARDLQMMRVLADLVAFSVSRDRTAAADIEEKRSRVERVIEQQLFCVAYQPIWNVRTQRLLGFESLARFSGQPPCSPDKWFAEAAEVGLGTALEFAVARMALSGLPAFPEEMYLSINASPQLILGGGLGDILHGLPAERIVLEVTEHAQVDDYDRLCKVLGPLRDQGMQLAVDDAGAGYASLQHILQLRPDVIKLDMCLTRHIDSDAARRALAVALVGFADSTGCRIIAEGVESALEMKALQAIGIANAQGFHLGRPMPEADAAALARQHAVGRPVAASGGTRRAAGFSRPRRMPLPHAVGKDITKP